MLVEAGLIDADALRSALGEQRRWGRQLGQTLLDMRVITEERLVETLAQQLGVAAIDLDQIRIPEQVIALVPQDLARRYRVVPFRQVMKFLDLAMADPTSMGVVEELQIRTHLNVRTHIAGPNMIARAVATYYGITDDIPMYGSDVFEHGAPPATAATSGRERKRVREGIPAGPSQPASTIRDVEVLALQARITELESLVERNELVLRKLLALLIEKGVASREEILERLK